MNQFPATASAPLATVEWDFVIVGGGIAAVTAANTLRSEGAHGSILLLSDDDSYPSNRPPVTKGLLAGRLSAQETWIAAPEEYARRGIEVRLGSPVTTIRPEQHQVLTADGYRAAYNKLLVATGSIPQDLRRPGRELAGIFHLHSVSDALAMREYLAKPGRVIIVGTSFVALEAATTLSRMQHRVTLLDEADSIFPRIASPELARFFLQRSEESGLEVRLEESVEAFVGTERITQVKTTRGATLDCDAVILAVGVRPCTGFLKGSGLKVERGILVDEFLQTDDADVFAAGDVARYADRRGVRHRTEHWENARKQGRIAAKNMLGRRIPYDNVTHYFCDFLDFSFNFLGDSRPADTRVQRGRIEDKDFAEFYLRSGRIVGLFSTGRPAEETQAVETLIRDRTPVEGEIAELSNPAFDIAQLARTPVLILQGGGALGAFECGTVRAMEELGLYPRIVGGVSIGAINGAIVASHPGNAAAVLESFWDELSVTVPGADDYWTGHAMAAWQTMAFGIPHFFRPRWLQPPTGAGSLPVQWTSLYDLRPLKKLLTRYIDFKALDTGPVRLIIGAVDVEQGHLTFFDSRVEEITVDHVLASCSLPPIFQWTTIGERHYWDGGLISNSPLEHVLMKCGANHKDIYIIDLFPGERRLPSNLAEVLTRRDEITYGERIRRDAQVRELVHDFQALVGEIMLAVEPERATRLKQRSRYVDLMGLDWTSTITRIVRESEEGEWPALDYDFSVSTVHRHMQRGYELARERLAEQAAAPS